MSFNGPLIEVARQGNLQKVMQYIEHGADIHACDDCALRLSAENGHLDVVQYLVNHGAYIHACNDWALRYSIQNGHDHVTDFLTSYIEKDRMTYDEYERFGMLEV